MSFMEIEILDKDRVFEVDTDYGLYYVPADCAMPPDCLALGVQVTDDDEPIFEALTKLVNEYVPVDAGRINSITVRLGYLGRYQAPGYMDSTDWMFGTNHKQLVRELKETYGD